MRLVGSSQAVGDINHPTPNPSLHRTCAKSRAGGKIQTLGVKTMNTW